MKPLDLCVFSTSFTIFVAILAIIDLGRRRTIVSLLNVAITLGAVVATTIVGFYLEPGTSYLQLLAVLIRERDISAVVSIGLGAAAALAWLAFSVYSIRSDSDATSPPGFARNVCGLLLAVSVVGVVLCSQAFIWKGILGFQRDPAVRVHAPQFRIEKIADLEVAPVRIAVSEEGRVYVSYDYFESWGAMGGAIIELSPDDQTGQYRQRIVADSTLLMRSYGLVARQGALYVSRTGIHSNAQQGRVSYKNTGAVTVLKDLDGDGYFEFADDLLPGLPGAQGPDTMHQNNGIAFAEDGSLYVTTGSSSNRALDEHPWAGGVLKLSADGSQVDVFARGFRNPFGIVIGPDGELFVTENDIDENPGDEINHVIQGEHYGHPFVVPNEPAVDADGFRDPIFVGELESNLLGMAYATSDNLPEEFRDCLYVADYMGGQILRMKLEKSGDTYRVADQFTLATLTTPLDIAVGPQGDLFVITRRTQNVYRIRLRDSQSR